MKKRKEAKKNKKLQDRAIEPEIVSEEATEISTEAVVEDLESIPMPESDLDSASLNMPVPVSPQDPLQQYMREIQRYAVLPPEEQIELAKKFKETENVAIAKLLVSTNLRLVVKIAMEYRNSYNNIMDLIQEGNIGLMKAVSNFDPYKGTRLSYYASWWIRSYILKFLLDNFRLVKVGTTQAQKKLFYNLMKEKQRLEAQGIDAGPKLLAEKLNVREKDVEEMSLRLSSRGGEVSIDKPMLEGDSDSSSFSEMLESEQVNPDVLLAQNQLRNILVDRIEEFVAALNEKERMVFQERLMSEDPQTLQKIADSFGFSRERARQIEANVIKKLREYLRNHMDDLPSEG